MQYSNISFSTKIPQKSEKCHFSSFLNRTIARLANLSSGIYYPIFFELNLAKDFTNTTILVLLFRDWIKFL